MAYITNMQPDFTNQPLFNLESTVGSSGKNLPSDVYLMQILFWEASKGSKFKYGFTSFAYNGELEKALQDFKRLSNESARKTNDPSWKVYYEGHIDPAKGSSRAFGSNRLWSICKLNHILHKRVKASGYSGDIVEYVYKTYPSARNMIADRRTGIANALSGISDFLQSVPMRNVFMK